MERRYATALPPTTKVDPDRAIPACLTAEKNGKDSPSDTVGLKSLTAV
jgi:hypothetical protein